MAEFFSSKRERSPLLGCLNVIKFMFELNNEMPLPKK